MTIAATLIRCCAAWGLASTLPASLHAATVTAVAIDTATGPVLPLHVGGRVVRTAAGYTRQWPGTYFDGAFRGDAALMRVGPGDVILHVHVDAAPAIRLVKPRPGLYRISGLSQGRHRIRVDVASESQAGATVFGGLYAAPGGRPQPVTARRRQIEFIGDSHTVGYGNTSPVRDCSKADVWATTDTTRGIAAITAQRYGADYRVNAISGRGIVRNYDGGPGNTLPAAYPFALLDHTARATDAGWHPRLIVIALGTNDFSTALHAGEPWQTRAALRTAFEARYVAFIRHLRNRHPRAAILLWATDLADGAIAAAASAVATRLTASGLPGIGFVAVPGLAFSGCHAHPSIADDGRIAAALARHVDAHPEIWTDGARKRP